MLMRYLLYSVSESRFNRTLSELAICSNQISKLAFFERTGTKYIEMPYNANYVT